MTTPIHTFQDIINAVRDNPNLREELRLHLLGEELLKLPAQFAEFVRVTHEHNQAVNRRLERLEEGQTRLEQGQTSLRESLDALTTEVSTIGGNVSRLTGDDYERQASRIAVRRARTHLGVTEARIVGRAAGTDPDPIANIANIAALGGLITEEEADELERADLVLQGVKDGQQVYVLAEISITVQARDAHKALQRAAILQKASDTKTIAAAFGQTIAEDATRNAPDQVTLIVIPQEA